jgi:hypothetical protein
MSTLANCYTILDDSGFSTGAAGMSPGGGTGAPLLSPIGQFQCTSLATAATVAYLFSSIFQRPVRLCPIGSAPPYTLIIGAAATVALTAVPSGVTY